MTSDNCNVRIEIEGLSSTRTTTNLPLVKVSDVQFKDNKELVWMSRNTWSITD